MESAIVSIICVALIVVGGMTMSQSFLSSVDTTATGLSNVSQIDEKILRTDISIISTNVISPNDVQITVRNSGKLKLSDFSKWDLIVQYYENGGDYQIKWLPFTTSGIANNQWELEGIYLSGGLTPEVFEPGIFNPGEDAVFAAKVNPNIGNNTTNMVTIATDGGVIASAMFVRN